MQEIQIILHLVKKSKSVSNTQQFKATGNDDKNGIKLSFMLN